MKVPLTVQLVSTNLECYEDTSKTIKYKVINTNRFVVTDIQVKAKTIKENGENTSKNYCKEVSGVKDRLMPKADFTITCTIKMPKDYNETIKLGGETVLSVCDLDISVVGKLVIAKS